MELGGSGFTKRWEVRTHPIGSPDGFSKTKGFVSIDNQFILNDTKIDLISEGMNEDGLTVSSLTFQEALYQKDDKSSPKPKLYQGYVVPWILGQFSTVQEAINGLNETIVIDPFESLGSEFGETATRFHWAISDALGNSVVVEYLDREMKVHVNTQVKVLTNDPDFKWHL